jgi:hypothetical protein
MLYREIISVCSQTHTKHINTLCGQNEEFFNIIPGGAYSNHWALSLISVHVPVANSKAPSLSWYVSYRLAM